VKAVAEMTEAKQSTRLKILPCPFCGGAGSFVNDDDYGYVECSSCGAKGSSFVFDDTASEAENREDTIRESWNRRTKGRVR